MVLSLHESASTERANKSRERLVILGSGWAAFRMLRGNLNSYHVSVVSPRNHFLFTPLLPSVSVGTIEPRSITEPTRMAAHLEEFHYYLAECTSVDHANQVIKCESPHVPPFELKYDKLVIAVGCDVNTFGVQGVKEHAFFMKELIDATKMRERVIQCFEQASFPNCSDQRRKQLLQFVIVGAGPTGVESAAELHDFIHQDVTRTFPEVAKFAHIVILEASQHILTQFEESLRDFTIKTFAKKKIEIRLGAVVSQVTETSVMLRDGTVIDCGICLWSAGIGPRSFVKDKLDVQKDHRSKILVDNYLRVKGMQNMYALGDCSVFVGDELAATAQVAQQQGRYLAKSLNLLAHGKAPRPFTFKFQGMLAYVGDYMAIASVGRYKGKGVLAWLFWRSAYLTRLVSIRNKILVALDWIKTFVFGRDISKIN